MSRTGNDNQTPGSLAIEALGPLAATVERRCRS
jgi:hypothetical protein